MAETGSLVRQEPLADGVRSGRSGHQAPGERRGGGRHISRRRSLGGSRALVGGLLVAAAAVGLYSAYTHTEGGPADPYVVARHAMAAGARLTEADLTTAPMDLPPSVGERAFRDPRALAGATLITPVATGELIQASAVVAKPSAPTARELTFSIERDALPPTLEHGERIDVLATMGTGEGASTSMVADDLLLVGLDAASGRLGERSSVSLTVALDDPADALALAHALSLGRLTVVRATGAAPFGPVPPYRHPVPGSAPTVAPTSSPARP
jgi:hypothetical protein